MTGREALHENPDFKAWLSRWRSRGAQESQSPAVRAETLRRANPKYIPRNHRIEEVIVAATTADDFAPFEALLEVIVNPFDEQSGAAAYAAPRFRNSGC
ncbi:MAG: protein adenylyltransferase SelO family protein [Steroidobacteraceae bacterium]